MIRAFGSDAPSIMRKRVKNHLRSGTADSADFWQRVADAVDQTLMGHARPPMRL